MAKESDWELEVAGQRVQIIKQDAGAAACWSSAPRSLPAADRSLVALLGASPGASTAVWIMVHMLENCFHEQLSANGVAQAQGDDPVLRRYPDDDAALCRAGAQGPQPAANVLGAAHPPRRHGSSVDREQVVMPSHPARLARRHRPRSRNLARCRRRSTSATAPPPSPIPWTSCCASARRCCVPGDTAFRVRECDGRARRAIGIDALSVHVALGGMTATARRGGERVTLAREVAPLGINASRIGALEQPRTQHGARPDAARAGGRRSTPSRPTPPLHSIAPIAAGDRRRLGLLLLPQRRRHAGRPAAVAAGGGLGQARASLLFAPAAATSTP